MTMAQAFNEWMRRYVADPRVFQAEFEAVASFEKGPRINREPVYGRERPRTCRSVCGSPLAMRSSGAAIRGARDPRRRGSGDEEGS